MLENLLKPLADYFINLGLSGMALVSYLEAIFLPIPPDIVLFTNALFNPHNAWLYAVVAGVGSAFGAATNYFIGQKGGRVLFHAIFKNQHERLDKIEKLCQKYGVLTVFIIAFTPIPFMIFTMASGIFELNFLLFFLACLVGRTLRFLTFVSLIVIFGEQIKNNLDIFFLVAAILIGTIYVILHRPRVNSGD